MIALLLSLAMGQTNHQYALGCESTHGEEVKLRGLVELTSPNEGEMFLSIEMRRSIKTFEGFQVLTLAGEGRDLVVEPTGDATSELYVEEFFNPEREGSEVFGHLLIGERSLGFDCIVLRVR